MASSLASASTLTKVTAAFHLNNTGERDSSHSLLSFHLSHKPQLRIFTKLRQRRAVVVQAQLNEVRPFQWFSLEDLFSNIRSFVDMLLGSSVAYKVPIDGSSNAANTPPAKSDVPALEVKDADQSKDPSNTVLATEESVSEFISQVASLVKLVDSRDIVELQLKQLDCEVVIRKKEALPQPPSPAPPTMIYSPSPPVAPPSPPMTAPASVPASPAVSQLRSSSPSVAKPAKSSLPPFKCPMAGTLYRSPAPGEPPFVKVGDKVQKGQVICIIEAMKLMNEIEADQSGTIVEILAEDGKPVSVDTPLLIIEP